MPTDRKASRDEVLAGRAIELWVLPHECAELDVAEAWLMPDEKSRAGRYLLDRARDEFLAGRFLVRLALSRLLGVAPNTIRFGRSARGRPILQKTDGVPSVSFSLSHSAGLVICAIACGRIVGADIEGLAPIWKGTDLLRRCLHVEERLGFERPPLIAPDRILLEHWVYKEAYVKALGQGLTLPFDDFLARRLDGTLVRFEHNDPSQPQREMHLLRPNVSDRHLAAIVVEKTASGAPRLLIYDGSSFLAPGRVQS